MSPLAGIDVELDDGEMVIDTPTRMIGYMERGILRFDEKERRTQLRTGDVFEAIEGGFRFVVRRRNVISRLGEKISLRHIEDIVRSHPGVSDARCVLGSDEKLTLNVSLGGQQEVPDNPLSARDLNQFCRKQLRSAEMPTVIEIVDQVRTK